MGYKKIAPYADHNQSKTLPGNAHMVSVRVRRWLHAWGVCGVTVHEGYNRSCTTFSVLSQRDMRSQREVCVHQHDEFCPPVRLPSGPLLQGIPTATAIFRRRVDPPRECALLYNQMSLGDIAVSSLIRSTPATCTFEIDTKI